MINATELLAHASPIPVEAGQVSGWKEIPVNPTNEPLVPLGIGSQYSEIFTNSVYAGERADSPYRNTNKVRGSLSTCFVREEVAQQLAAAEALLPKGLHLIVYDTYRPLEVQGSLFDQYYSALKAQHSGWTEERLLTETQKYVSVPSHDATRPSPHNTGGSVDVGIIQLPLQVEEEVTRLTQALKNEELSLAERYLLEVKRMALIAQNAQLLNFGTQFDYGGKEAAIAHYEQLAQHRKLKGEDREALISRRALYEVMTSVGFEPYADEWWHFNSRKSQMGARTAGLNQAQYGAMILSTENVRHERQRRKYARRLQRIQSGFRLTRSASPAVERSFVLFEAAAGLAGNMDKTNLQEAAIIRPPKRHGLGSLFR